MRKAGALDLLLPDVDLLENTDIGLWGLYEGQKVPLDLPMLDESLNETEYIENLNFEFTDKLFILDTLQNKLNMHKTTRMIQKTIILLISLLFLPLLVFGQETVNVNVSTTIQDAIALTKVDDLVFGVVQAGDVVSVSSTTNALSNTGSTAKRATITSSTTLPTVYTFSGLGFTNNVISLPYVSGGGVAPAASISVTLNYAVNSTSPATYVPGTSTGANTAAGNTLYIGGTFTAPTGDSVGATYSGAITVSVIYL